MKKEFLELIVVGFVLAGVVAFTPNTIYAQKPEHKKEYKMREQKKDCDMKDMKNCNMNKENKHKYMMMQYDETPEVIKSAVPVYPESMRKKGIEGRVYICTHVDVYGKPTSVHVAKSSGYESLDSSAMVAAKQYQFKPIMIENKPIETTIKIPFDYKLNK